jgi:pimeloyl-ACP methyl ester carboxylesterase/DNA-binding CsgD family transcriptional regulator
VQRRERDYTGAKPIAAAIPLAMPVIPQQIRFCKGHDGARIAYATSGTGPPLVKAANWLSHLEFDGSSPVWIHLLRELSRENALVRYDARGCGLSDWDVELSFDAWVGDLEAVVEASGCKRFPLLGISQGASIAIAYAVRHPERVSHLILHGGYARGRLKWASSANMREEADMMIRLAELGWGQQNPAFRQFFTTQFIPDGTPEQHQWFNELERISTSPANAGRFIRVLNSIDIVSLLPQVACPTLVFHCVRDARVPFDEGRLIATMIDGARFVPLESNNHLLLDNEPAWSRWVAELRAFLPAVDQRSPVFDSLTPRERDLVELIAQGRDNAQIAAHLGLSAKTVRNHITSIFAKLGVENRAQAIVLARNAGFGAG